MLRLVRIISSADAYEAVLRSPTGTPWRVRVTKEELLDRGRFARAVNLQTGRTFTERCIDVESWRGLLWFKFAIRIAVEKEQDNGHRT